MATKWVKVKPGHDNWQCTKRIKPGYCPSAAAWESTDDTGSARCAQHGPKPTVKRKAKFKRWTVVGASLQCDGELFLKAWLTSSADSIAPTIARLKKLTKALNAARVALLTERKVKP